MVMALAAGQCAAAAGATESPGKYVAMGSSYAAGPGISAPADGRSEACGQSTVNYAHQLAQRRQLDLVDVSCSGATTADILERGQQGFRPQVEAVTADATLVTVTIGGNDLAYIGTMNAMACKREPLVEPEVRANFCNVLPRSKTEAALPVLEQNLSRIVTEVRRRAPRARLVLVGYLPVLPETGSCAQLKLADDEIEWLRWVVLQLNEITKKVAAETATRFLDGLQLGRGHDACAAEPWTNAFTIREPGVALQPAPFHPNAAGMTAVATQLDLMLDQLPAR